MYRAHTIGSGKNYIGIVDDYIGVPKGLCRDYIGLYKGSGGIRLDGLLGGTGHIGITRRLFRGYRLCRDYIGSTRYSDCGSRGIIQGVYKTSYIHVHLYMTLRLCIHIDPWSLIIYNHYSCFTRKWPELHQVSSAQVPPPKIPEGPEIEPGSYAGPS